MSRRKLIKELGVRPDENLCTSCYSVPPEWYRAGDGAEKCAACDAPRDDSQPALTIDEESLREAAEKAS